ncbi:Prokaryotic dksA/traR C4-type zinc finger [Pirellulimonas nuda]|uniref:Prokaryotic dksA/traR C4-type zinc finger n=1 Tax=Pirellulimonas nuda TaxID=2528009 RepID=A0A518DGR2_9BACT|nr:TraR/DksA C4-type zinc finger protein [Pirellulimonas nuda]QDU90661.1 Prokaryotic dksA/traR C4-type zinc finger [Pirellulimonas nuda]
MLSKTFHCDACGWRGVEGSAGVANRLRAVGQLKREKHPHDELLEQLLPAASQKLVCAECGAVGLRVAQGEESEEEDADDWQAAVLCEGCRKPIPPERLEALPDTRRCVACQAVSESDPESEWEPEFCPRCGALVELRVSSAGGLTRYRRYCTGGCRSVAGGAW